VVKLTASHVWQRCVCGITVSRCCEDTEDYEVWVVEECGHADALVPTEESNFRVDVDQAPPALSPLGWQIRITCSVCGWVVEHRGSGSWLVAQRELMSHHTEHLPG
jgi:hypothetical protein